MNNNNLNKIKAFCEKEVAETKRCLKEKDFTDFSKEHLIGRKIALMNVLEEGNLLEAIGDERD